MHLLPLFRVCNLILFSYHLTLFRPSLVTWRSYKGWFRPWLVGIGLTRHSCISNSWLNSILSMINRKKNQDPLILGNSTIVETLMHCDCSTTRRDFLLNVLVSRQMITNASHFRSAFLYSANFCTIQRKDLYLGVLQYFRRIWSWFLMQLYY